MQFIDEANIAVKAGDGGSGCVAFRREAHVPRGGPSGGDGGHGGDVVIVADGQLTTLSDLRYKRNYAARRGEDGRGRDQYGSSREPLTIRVPVGTAIHGQDNGDLLADLTEDGQKFVAAKGGLGGLGNIHFAKPWNQAPRESTPGTPGEQRDLRLELKLLAEVGLLGFPNAGKSTFLSRISGAKPKIADYPFTTLTPNLGVVELGQERSFVIADIPGLIPGASEGAGLGNRFLKHVERTRVLIHVLDPAFTTGPERDPLADFDTLNRELHARAPELAAKSQVVVLNKCDLTEADELAETLEKKFAERQIRMLTMSAATGAGVKAVLEAAWKASRITHDC